MLHPNLGLPNLYALLDCLFMEVILRITTMVDRVYHGNPNKPLAIYLLAQQDDPYKWIRIIHANER